MATFKAVLRFVGVVWNIMSLVAISCAPDAPQNPLQIRPIPAHAESRDSAMNAPPWTPSPLQFHHDPYPYRPDPGPWEYHPGPWSPVMHIWISSFTASPPVVVRGQPVQLSWNAPGAQSVSIDGVGGGYGPSGSVSVFPASPVTYQLHAYGFQGQEVAASVYVQVTEPPARVVTYQVSPLFLQQGDSSTVSWYVENCQVVQLIVSGPSNGTGAYGCYGQIQVQPQGTSVYSLQAVGLDGQMISGGSYTVSVDVPLPVPKIHEFRAETLTITQGESTRLQWSVSHASSVAIFGVNPPQQASSGFVTIAPMETQTYVLRAVNPEGRIAERSLTVTVEKPIPSPVIEQFTIIPPSVDRGQPVTITWRVTHCSELTIEGLVTQGPLPCEGRLEVIPSQSTLFQLVARNARGQAAYQSVYLPVRQPPPWPVILSFRAESPEIFEGQSLSISWETADASRVQITGGGLDQEVAPSGHMFVAPSVTATYELRASNERQQMTSAFMTVRVRAPYRPSIEFFRSDQPLAIGRRPLILSWKGNHCQTIEIPGVLAPTTQGEGSVSYIPRQTRENLILRCRGEASDIVEASLIVEALPEGSTTDDAVRALIRLMGGTP